MKSNKGQKAEMEKIQRQRSGCAIPLSESMHLCKEFGFTTGMLKGSLVKGRGEK